MSWIYQRTVVLTSSGGYTVPAGVSAIDVHAKGAGGNGGDYNPVVPVSGAGGGGGGTEYMLKYGVQQGDQFSVTISNGQATFTKTSNGYYFRGDRGNDANLNTPGSGGASTNYCFPATNLAGGYGGDAQDDHVGGVGGSSYGSYSGSGGAAGTQTLGGGNGGNYGGGGGGGGDSAGLGGPAAVVIVEYALQNQ